jgi:hypothetical protein
LLKTKIWSKNVRVREANLPPFTHFHRDKGREHHATVIPVSSHNLLAKEKNGIQDIVHFFTFTLDTGIPSETWPSLMLAHQQKVQRKERSIELHWTGLIGTPSVRGFLTTGTGMHQSRQIFSVMLILESTSAFRTKLTFQIG